MKKTNALKKRTLKVETLEDRKLMAVDFANGTLTVTGTPGNDQVTVAANGHFLTYSIAPNPWQHTNIPIRAIRNIDANLGSGQDVFWLGGMNSHLWNLDSVRVNMGTGGWNGNKELVWVDARSIGNLNVRSASLSGTEVRLHADQVDAAMIDLARQPAEDLVHLNLRRAGKIDVRTYDGNDRVHLKPPQATNDLRVRELKINMGNGDDDLRLEGGVIDRANIQMGAGTDQIIVDHWNGVTIHDGTIDGGNGTDSIFNRNRLRGRAGLMSFERVR